jgi:hydroxymethylglutaryl-CoA synthase
MAGLVAYGTYIPYNRLKRSEIAAVLGAGGGRGTRAVASYDQDSTTMGVESARLALATLPPPAKAEIQQLFFATASPAYADKTNAAAIHAALGLDEDVLAVDMAGATRSAVGALVAGRDASVPTMVVLADVRTGRPGGADERDGGDGAATLLFGGDAPVIAELVGRASTTAEFLDRWRLPDVTASRSWEERFGEHVYGPLADGAFADALKQAGLTPSHVDHLIVTGVHARAARQFTTSSGVRPEALARDLAEETGNTGAAHPGILLGDVLDRAEPDQVIAVVVLADGASVLLFRTTEAFAGYRAAASVSDQIAAGSDGLSYGTFLSWRGQLDREPPRRPDPEPPYAPPSHRSDSWKFGFVGSRCEECGTRHLPPGRVCRECGAVDHIVEVPLADTPATIATFTVDRLAYTPSPPLVAAVIDFDGGGRFRCQLTDLEPSEAAIGGRVEMTFRKMVTSGGIHNYFWKARPIRRPAASL